MSAPVLSAYSLNDIRLRLLQNPKKYHELCSEVSSLVEKKKKTREHAIWFCSIVTALVCALIAYLYDRTTLCFVILLFSTMIPIISGALYWLFAAIIPNVSEPSGFQNDGWIWVRLTDTDKANYKRYTLACDEYNHVIFDINWDDVTYKDGDVEIALKSRGIVIRYSCDSKSYYAAYKSDLLSEFGQLRAEAKDGQYIIVNPYVIEESILIIIRHLELLEKQRLARINALINSNPEILEACKNQATIIVTIKARKSDYLNHLLNHQVPGISVISTMECCAYATGTTDSYERAYVFAVMNSSGRYCVIYENANEDNASIVAKVDSEEKCYECVAAMVNYMRSHSVNKRETLRSTHNINGFAVRSINHDDIATWKSHVTGDYYVRNTSRRKYKRRWRRW